MARIDLYCALVASKNYGAMSSSSTGCREIHLRQYSHPEHTALHVYVPSI